ncbi:MAG: hypothetical protein ABSG14_09270 [Verrucomicrobiia bacterium]|jgi:hypothetical protein
MVRIYDNTAIASVPPNYASTNDVYAPISAENQSAILSALLLVKPLETKIWIDSQEPRRGALGRQIQDAFIKGGFTTAQIVDKPNFSGWSIPAQWVTTNGIQIVMQDNPDQSMLNAMGRLCLSVGSQPSVIAGRDTPAQLMIIVRNQ